MREPHGYTDRVTKMPSESKACPPGDRGFGMIMLAGVTVGRLRGRGLAWLVREAGADVLADRLEHALTVGTKLLALTIDERASSSISSTTRRMISWSCALCS